MASRCLVDRDASLLQQTASLLEKGTMTDVGYVMAERMLACARDRRESRRAVTSRMQPRQVYEDVAVLMSLQLCVRERPAADGERRAADCLRTCGLNGGTAVWDQIKARTFWWLAWVCVPLSDVQMVGGALRFAVVDVLMGCRDSQ